MAFSLRVSASFRFPLYGMHGVSATRPIGHESFFQASIIGLFSRQNSFQDIVTPGFPHISPVISSLASSAESVG